MNADGFAESVWDYTCPPVVRAASELAVVELGGTAVARTEQALQVLETSHPVDLLPAHLGVRRRRTRARVWVDVLRFQGTGRILRRGRGSATGRTRRLALPQDGGFYGGWNTSRVTGPFKAAPGTLHR